MVEEEAPPTPAETMHHEVFLRTVFAGAFLPLDSRKSRMIGVGLGWKLGSGQELKVWTSEYRSR